MAGRIENAKIDSTHLGFEDHGILSFMLHLSFGGSSQGFGGYGISGANAFCSQVIAGILGVAGVGRWEDLRGKHVRVERDPSWNGRILRIGHIIEDRWFDPADLAKKVGASRG